MIMFLWLTKALRAGTKTQSGSGCCTRNVPRWTCGLLLTERGAEGSFWRIPSTC
uniref:Uncharacterized protein n=1 Tax=Anguilla anguilla TaxID=7936 RepID=A0A0E9VFY2_ANGAN